jgi:nitric oxide reductase NorD protein
MSEAEDVILSAAERATSATRRLWSRTMQARDGAIGVEADPTSALLRLERWLVACFGRSWPIALCDPPAPAGWLRRALDPPAPWRTDPLAVAATDGARLLLPREAVGSESVHLAALALGRRLVSGERRSSEPSALHRDVHWALEAAQGDAALAALLPGIASSLRRARAAALATRPPLEALRTAERSVEQFVRALLVEPVCPSDRRIAELCEVDARDYRGVAPVAHWGVASDPDRAGLAGARPNARDDAPSRRPAFRRLARSLRRRPVPEEPSRPGPFIVPPTDPHLSVQDPRGVDRLRDRGDEELDALAEEIARLDELPVVRSERPVREVLQSPGSSPISAAAEPSTPRNVEALSYPEWDFRCSAYRDRGIVLRESPVVGTDPEWAARVAKRQAPLVTALRRQFLALRPRLERLRRQIDGDDIDVDGWVDEHAERRSGLSPPGHLYRRARRRRRDLAVALLVDASGSTDAWVSRDARVIDVAKEAALCFSEALGAVGDRHAIYAFSGQGPGDVRVWVAKRFAEPLGAGVRARIGGLAPDRSTRLGGPIRHVTAALGRVAAHTRILLLLSDGKPNDEDAYEGEYGVEDARQALHEAVAAGVRPFCVTIDRRGSAYLPRLFGPSGYTLLWDPLQLPRRLPQIYRHLTRGLSA